MKKNFQKLKLNQKNFFSKKEINKISKKIDKKIKKSIDLAFNRIKKFHSQTKIFSFKFKDKYKNEFLINILQLKKLEFMCLEVQQVIQALF
jgi:histidinol dehydrogenase